VAGISARLGRHALLLQAHCLAHLRGRVSEPIVFDHFETFEFTQDYPFGVGTAVGSKTWFVYTADPAPHGRSGRRSLHQERRLRRRPQRRTYGRYLGSTRRVLACLLRLKDPSHPLRLVTDAHSGYSRALAHHVRTGHVNWKQYPNPARGPRGSPRPPEAAARDTAMFPVDLLHKIFRHTLAHHRRETIAFSRRINAATERLFLTAIWRNLVKKRSERRGRDCPTPAMSLGLTTERWGWRRVLSRRLFYHREVLPEPYGQLYRRQWTTPVLASNLQHELTHAF
jgi:hypothetical protein